ncbi:hypothetical protein KAF25_010375 [Fusarium avenaceum]|uniref:Major facilitator superfamily (MFS) profile domain-containing protein n=1 Tax=Fusarium avenaceum TaxID=40199 RepID=A0A9P7GTV2_9HYPO|nr:hypothetical protein KAF25_010375 [Fusarium avenaceum]
MFSAVQITASAEPPRPIEALEVEEPRNDEDNMVFPTGPKLWSTMASMAITCFLSGLDLTIVAVAVPSITDEFQTIADIGWYSAAYGMTLSAFVFFFGQIYTLFSIKAVFLIGIATFEIGALICTLAPSSAVFILGRAISGLGRGAINGGLFKLLRQCFPLSKQAISTSFFGAVQSIGLITAPTIGGALIDAFSWRACFGVNVPLGVVCFALTAYGVHEQPFNRADAPTLTLKEKFKKVDLIGTLLAVPAITCLLMSLQWGGSKFGWGTWQIIVPLVICGILFAGFGYLQYYQGDNALLPPRILKQRSIIAGMWYGACCEGVLAVTEFYMSIYFQGVRGYSPTKAGLLALPMVGGLAIALIISGLGTTWTGYYYPFMLATSVLTPVASGLLTTLNLEEQIAKAVALLTFLGLAVGLGLQGPQVALQAVLPIEDVSLGGAVLSFGSGMGSALWICASATLFQDRLTNEIRDASPGTDIAKLQEAGLSKLRESIGSDRLKSVLAGYENAVVQTLYIPLALALLTIIGSCNGQRPLCSTCIKFDTECVYDSDVRESRVRSLQNANEKLENELEAANILLRKVASGPDGLRSLVLQYMDAGKQPLDIVQALSNSEELDAQSSKEKETRYGGESSNSTSSSQTFDVLGTESSGTYVQSSQAQGSLRESGYYSMKEPMTMNSSFEQLYPSVSCSSGSLNGSVQEYTAISDEISGNHTLASSQIIHSQPQIATSTKGFTNPGLANSLQTIIAYPTGNQSLFCEPLFDHTDFYLATSVVSPMQQNAHIGPGEGMVSQNIPTNIPQGQLLESTGTFIPKFNTYPPSEPVSSKQAAEDIPATSPQVHPNYRNHFNNLALSSSIRTNGYPRYIQDAQIRNIFAPNWAVTSLNTEPDPGGLEDAFGDIFKKATGLLKKGEPIHHIVGHHPNIAALYDQEQFDKSCLLSQWAARMVHSVKRQGYDFTCFASMNVFWYVMRWMIYPSPDTYAAMPEWIRPTSNQLFTPHISMADFVLWPAFRDLVVQLPQLQERMAWLADMSTFIRCEWPYELEHALHRDPVSMYGR